MQVLNERTNFPYNFGRRGILLSYEQLGQRFALLILKHYEDSFVKLTNLSMLPAVISLKRIVISISQIQLHSCSKYCSEK